MTINHGDLGYEFRRMRIFHPLLKEAHREFDRLRQLRQKMLETGEDVEANCFGLFAESQAGKTVTVMAYLENQVVDYCYKNELFPRSMPRAEVVKAQRVVVYISITGSTLKSFFCDILRAYGDPRLDRGNISDLAFRVYNYIRRFNTELLIIDETQHLRIGAPVSSARLEATRVHNCLKDFLLSGFPLVFVGTEEAERKIMNDVQVGFRSCRKIAYRKLEFRLPEDRQVFEDYCGLLGLKLAQHKLFPKRSNFLAGDIVACLFEATGGYLGRVSRLVEAAAAYALEEGSDAVERHHLFKGCEDFSIANGLVRQNPFREH